MRLARLEIRPQARSSVYGLCRDGDRGTRDGYRGHRNENRNGLQEVRE